MTAAAIQKGCDPENPCLSNEGNTIHVFISSYSYWIRRSSGRLYDAQLSELLTYLISIGCDLERRNYYGETPLLQACRFRSYDISKILARKGANVTATDSQGCGVLHLLLDWIPELEDGEDEQLCDALILALENGCDPNQLSTVLAWSPSDCLGKQSRWAQWTEALKLVGYRLVETAEVDEYGEETTWIVVSADDPDGTKLPVSGMTLDEWKAERHRVRAERVAEWRSEHSKHSESKSQSEASNSASTASEVDDNSEDDDDDDDDHDDDDAENDSEDGSEDDEDASDWEEQPSTTNEIQDDIEEYEDQSEAENSYSTMSDVDEGTGESEHDVNTHRSAG